MVQFFRAVVIGGTILIMHGLARCETELAAEILWETSPNAAVESTMQSGRPLLIYVAADACGYCRKMEATTWADKLIRERIAAQFVPLKIDGQRQAALSQWLGVRAFPTMLVVAPTGHLVGRREGFVDPREMSDFLHAAALASNAHLSSGTSPR